MRHELSRLGSHKDGCRDCKKFNERVAELRGGESILSLEDATRKARLEYVKPVVSDLCIDDILTTAFEQGISYWASKLVVVDDDYKGTDYASACVSRGGEVDIHEMLDESRDPEVAVHRLTKEKAIEGIILAAAHLGQSIEAFHDNHDANTADVAVQYAVLGEERYA